MTTTHLELSRGTAHKTRWRVLACPASGPGTTRGPASASRGTRLRGLGTGPRLRVIPGPLSVSSHPVAGARTRDERPALYGSCSPGSLSRLPDKASPGLTAGPVDGKTGPGCLRQVPEVTLTRRSSSLAPD